MERIKRVWVDRIGSGYGYGAQIGINGITEIKEAIQDRENYSIKYYKAYRGNQLALELHNFSVVEYFTENS